MNNPQGQKKSCVLLMGRQKHLNNSAVLFAQQIFNIKATIDHTDKELDKEALFRMQPDFLISFLNEKILKGPVLQLKNVNFHPAPPEWPGRGGASLAIFHKAKTYGATAHIMSQEIDSGPILSVRRFAILPEESCESLFNRAQQTCLDLFYEIGTHIAIHGDLPEKSDEEWKRKAITRKQFEKWLELNIKEKDEFVRKVRAARHSQYPGPYILVHGYKFGLMGKQNEKTYG